MPWWPHLYYYLVFRVFGSNLVKRLKINMKINFWCFKVLLWTKKNHHYTIRICRLKIWKKRSSLDWNLIMNYIWQDKVVQILKERRLIIVLILVILIALIEPIYFLNKNVQSYSLFLRIPKFIFSVCLRQMAFLSEDWKKLSVWSEMSKSTWFK